MKKKANGTEKKIIAKNERNRSVSVRRKHAHDEHVTCI